MTPYVIALAALALLLLRQKFNADTETHGSSLLRHTTEKINRKKEDEQ